MPSSPPAEQAAARKSPASARRSARTMCEIAETTCRFAASQLADGLGPEEARQAALFVAGELAEVAAALRRLTRLGAAGAADRRAEARKLDAAGWSRLEIAGTLGVSVSTVGGYLRPRSAAGGLASGGGALTRYIEAVGR